jgi:hypothetical protein
VNALCANNFAISLSLIEATIAQSGLRWRMHTAQWFGMEMQSFSSFFTITKELSAEDWERLHAVLPAAKWMAGIPVEIDDTMPMSVIELVIELKLGKQILARVESLAIPSAFCP